MSSRPSPARKSSTDAESVSKASNNSRRIRPVMSVPPIADDEPVGGTANVIGREGVAAIHHQGLGPTSTESFQQTRQAQPSYAGYRQEQGIERPEPNPPFNYSSSYSPYMPQPPVNHDESIGVSTSAPPFNYSADDAMWTQTQPNPFPTQRGPAPVPTFASDDHFTPYQDHQPAQTYAPRSYAYAGPQYPAYNNQQAPRAAPAPDEWHQGRGATAQRRTGQGETPFPGMVPPVIPPMAPYYAPYAQHPSREAYAFVANDPWQPQIRRKHQKDVQTYDEVPLPSASLPPWMTHGRRPRMAGPQVPPPVIPPVYRPPTEASEVELVINPYPTVPELPPSNGSSSRIHRQASPLIPGPAPPSPPLFAVPSRRRSSTRSSSVLEESVRSDGQWETPSPVVDPISHPGHDDQWATKLSSTSWSTEIISHPSDIPTTPPPPAKTLLKRVANIFTKAFKTALRKPGNIVVSPQSSYASPSEVAFQFVVATLPSQVYLNILLRLPSLYFSRVARIFEEADLTLPELKKMALETASQTKGQVDFLAFESNRIPEYDRLKSTWESFIDSVMREYKTFNIISVLLLSAILTILQIESAADDPVTRYAALFSMICALVSLLFGCMYIIRFGSMRKTYKAAEWALEAKKTKASILWNVWVMLAMPAIWLTWSIILYIACIMSFIWRTSPQDANPPNPVSSTILLDFQTLWGNDGPGVETQDRWLDRREEHGCLRASITIQTCRLTPHTTCMDPTIPKLRLPSSSSEPVQCPLRLAVCPAVCPASANQVTVTTV
ncbi:hypothetical protein CPC08DRAFT_220150 [Agrocybe pediades]|nr:hypothetical protein CPC08DRAFT_220150 [Agrocybe pediades]